MSRKPCLSLMALVILSLSGCTLTHDRWSDPVTCVRHKCQAHKAWLEWIWCYEDVEHRHHFGKGFRAGYRDVLEGGNGCQPTLPPRCYWKSHYRSAEGRSRVYAWFDGFSHGALAAQQDGANAWNDIPISPTARANLQMSTASAQPNYWHGNGTPPPIVSPPPPPPPGPSVHVNPDDEDLPLLPEVEVEDSDSPAKANVLQLRPYE